MTQQFQFQALPNRNETCLQKDICKNVYSQNIHNSQKIHAHQLEDEFTNRGIAIHGLLLSNSQEEIAHRLNNMY